MLLQGHNLKGIVAQIGHAGKHITAKFLESRHPFFLAAHSDVALINQGRPLSFRTGTAPFVRRFRVPDLGAESFGLFILNGPRHISRQALPASTGPLDKQLV